MIRIDFSGIPAEEVEERLQRQWLATNGLGGYASGTIAGNVTWKYHGLLVAALPAPAGRTAMLSHLVEDLIFPDGTTIRLGTIETGLPSEFRLENHLPVWIYRFEQTVLEKRIFLPHGQNTVHVLYSLRPGSSACGLRLRPALNFRPFEGDPRPCDPTDYELLLHGRRFEVRSGRKYPPLRLVLDSPNSHFVADGGRIDPVHYRRDAERGYPADGQLFSPGYFAAAMEQGQTVALTASTEEWHVLTALEPKEALKTEMERRVRLVAIAAPAVKTDLGAALVLAADQFICIPAGRRADAARAHAAGDELRSIMAGYHWFGEWGRDTMISLEGLALVTGRLAEARWILRAYARYVHDGLIPNLFPEGKLEGLYHTADATLWYFHALDRYVRISGDRELLRTLLPALREIIAYHRAGTRFGIGVDPADGLLRQGQAGYQLTWMDAKVGDWVVTPRRGKAVEINALWYNALCLLAEWLGPDDAESGDLRRAADQVRLSFNRRFWNAALQCLYDVVDGEDKRDDPAVRPNQIFAVALPHPVLDPVHWPSVVSMVEQKLLTPAGLRSLSPDDPAYKPEYSGDLRSRDAAYHQGTVWAWLIGPFCDAWLKVHPDGKPEIMRRMEGFSGHLDEGCVGSISEIFDAAPPYHPRGCVAQAWSVAEVLRTLSAVSEPSARTPGR